MNSSNQTTVASKHLKVLRRRAEYLQNLKDSEEANSYDLAELAALHNVVNYIDKIKSFEDDAGVRVTNLITDIQETDTLEEIELILQER